MFYFVVVIVYFAQDRAIAVPLSLVSKVEEQSSGFMSRFVINFFRNELKIIKHFLLGLRKIVLN